MAEESIIAWTDNTWNPWMGCTKVSAGCTNCYAETLTGVRMRLDVWGDHNPRKRTSAAYWRKPARWNREAAKLGRSLRVFCASLCDVLEDQPEPNEWRADVWGVIRATPNLDWQLLTKRPERYADELPNDWGDGWPNVWLGTSIEDARVADRVRHLTAVPAVVHFVSYEPAIGPLAHAIDLSGVEWVIYGGESGLGFRREDKQWARDMHRACADAGVAFFHKQSAGYRTELGIELDGKIVREYPQEPRTLGGLFR